MKSSKMAWKFAAGYILNDACFISFSLCTLALSLPLNLKDNTALNCGHELWFRVLLEKDKCPQLFLCISVCTYVATLREKKKKNRRKQASINETPIFFFFWFNHELSREYLKYLSRDSQMIISNFRDHETKRNFLSAGKYVQTYKRRHIRQLYDPFYDCETTLSRRRGLKRSPRRSRRFRMERITLFTSFRLGGKPQGRVNHASRMLAKLPRIWIKNIRA